MRNCIVLLLIIFNSLHLFGNDKLTAVWEALERMDNALARKILEKESAKGENRVEATFALMLLNTIESKEKGNLELMKRVYPHIADPNPYLFSMWSDEGVTNGYTVKNEEQFDFIQTFLADPKVNGSIKGSARYLLAMHYIWTNEFERSREMWNAVGSVKNWQFTGPFDNSSGSGFDKNYLPISHPKPNAVFQSYTNADIKWFVPKTTEDDPYLAAEMNFAERQAIIYAQTFVDNPTEREVILGAGFTGSIKVWVNDQLVLEQEEDWRTDMDLISKRFVLPKGKNRVLVQLGFIYDTNYPNFIIRFVDENRHPIKDITSSSTYQAYSSEKLAIKDVPHFAEAFFMKKIAVSPKNILNHLLLANTYMRSNRYNEAINILEKAKKIYPKNPLIHFDLVTALSKIQDRTRLLKAMDEYRNYHPDSPFFTAYDYSFAMSNEDYNTAAEKLEVLKAILGEKNPDYLELYIKFLSAKKMYNELVATIDQAYEIDPLYVVFVDYKYRLAKNMDAEKGNAPEILEKYLAERYNGDLEKALMQDYKTSGNRDKAEVMMKKRMERHPADTRFPPVVANHYYRAERYDEALEVVNNLLKNVPYSSSLWKDKGYIEQARENDKAAIEAFKNALKYNPNLFDIRDKIRELEGKKPLASFFERKNVYETINAAIAQEVKSDEQYQYIFDESNTFVFPEGSYLEYNRLAIQVLNKAGIEHWKEASISYYNTQRLNIIQAQVIKKSGEKILAEQNDNELVFPNLEIGDAVYIEYQLENFASGKLKKEFWQQRVLQNYYPVQEQSYRLFVPQDMEIFIETRNMEDVKMKEKKVEDLKIYEWKLENSPVIASENYMPSSLEVGKSVFVSTVKDWRTIADWYQDLSVSQAKEDYNVEGVYQSIFEGKEQLSDYDKAALIYEYVTENITYSSLPFRQNNYIPQKPMVTISTQLGDCKDLSVLYYTLAQKAGLKTNLVLVNSRDNGQDLMPLPAIEFDHCIVKIDLPDQVLFQELTDPKLPFGYLPTSVQNAQALVIPNKSDKNFESKVINIPPNPNAEVFVKRVANIKVVEEDLEIETTYKTNGSNASYHRSSYDGLNATELKEKVQAKMSSFFTTTTKVNEFNFENQDNRAAEFGLNSKFIVEDAIVSIGSLKAIKPSFFEISIDLETYVEEARKHPFVSWRYETIDVYETALTYQLPEGEKWMEIPENVLIDDPIFSYNLEYIKISDTEVKINRRFKMTRENLNIEEFNRMKQIAKQVLKAEDAYLVF